MCFRHGTNEPVIQAAAARRIQTSVERRRGAASEYARWSCGLGSRDKIKIPDGPLDRDGLGATGKALGASAKTEPDESLIRDVLADPTAPAALTADQVHALPAKEAAGTPPRAWPE
ncbi:hypothetical protein GCM10027215_36470 [Nocardioides zeae]